MLAPPLAPPSVAEAEPIVLDAFELEEPCSATGVVDLILKRPFELDKRVRDPGLSGELVPRFLGISLGGFTLFGVAMALAMTAAGVWPELHAVAACLNDPSLRPLDFGTDATAHPMVQRWLDGSAVRLILAYNLGLIAATGICLPSLYFYGLLSGIRMTMLDVVMQSLKSKATAAIALVGILPIYVAICLGVQLFQWAPAVRDVVLWGTGAAVHCGPVGHPLAVLRPAIALRHPAGMRPRTAWLLSQPARAGLGRLLHGGHSPDDLHPVGILQPHLTQL